MLLAQLDEWRRVHHTLYIDKVTPGFMTMIGELLFLSLMTVSAE